MDLTRKTHDLIRAHFSNQNSKIKKRLAVDATCGNGFDSAFLADLGFEKLVALDVQKQAIANTDQRLKHVGYLTAELINDGHEHLAKYINQTIDCIMFNLGYMPNLENPSDTNKNITTQTDTSLKALEIALKHLSDNGLITLMCYPGHPQGAEETIAIQTWLTEVSKLNAVETHLAKSPKPTAPILYTIKKTDLS